MYDRTNAVFCPLRPGTEGKIIRSRIEPHKFWIWRDREQELHGQGWFPFEIRNEDIWVPPLVPAPLTARGLMPNPFYVKVNL